MNLSLFNRYYESNGDLYIYNINSQAAVQVKDTNEEDFKKSFTEKIDLNQFLKFGLIVNKYEVNDTILNYDKIINSVESLMVNIITSLIVIVHVIIALKRIIILNK